MRNFVIASAALILAACTGSRPETPTPAAGYDVVIENGRIVDGTGAAWFYGDLAISGDRIARIAPRGMLRAAPARRHVDATGLVVSPGFIDIQGQSGGDFLFGDGRDVSKVTQGITTEILGEGSTPAPANGKTLEGADLSDPKVAATVKTFEGQHGFDAWLRAMESHGISPNVGSFIGAGTVRQYAKGMTMGSATPAELDTMRTIVSNAMRDGAFGVGSALIYPPGNYATTAELIEEARAMSPFGGVYITHMRSEADQFLEALDEAIRIGREGGVPVEIYHLKAAGMRNWGKAVQAIAKIDSARAAGQDVQADMYPYVAGGTGLTACLPPWSAADGKLFDNLASAEMRTKMRAEIEHQTTEWENMCQLATPDGVLVLGLRKPENKKWAGMRLSQIATGMSKDYIDAAMDLILSERQRVGTVYFLMGEDNVKLQLRQPWMKIGTDAGGADPDSARGLVHPRSYGTYPRILGKYVRDEHVLPLEDAIRKMSSAVATRLSIHDRGVLREGMYADVVVFDPNTVIDRATFEQPHQPSIGVRHVFVNGTAVVQDGKHTGAKPGRVVRGPGYNRAPSESTGAGTPVSITSGRATSR